MLRAQCVGWCGDWGPVVSLAKDMWVVKGLWYISDMSLDTVFGTSPSPNHCGHCCLYINTKCIRKVRLDTGDSS